MFKTSKPELGIELTKDKMMDQYKKWNEPTETSPSGRHLGHFHALFRPFEYNLEDPGDKMDLEEKREVIIDVHFLMLQIASKTPSYVWPVKKHSHLHDRDDLESAKIYCLRVIHLYECNLNLLLGLYMRGLDQHCEDNHLLNKGLYGGRPGRRSIVHVTQVEITMITRRILVRFNNDATACFDRIMPHIVVVLTIVPNAS